MILDLDYLQYQSSVSIRKSDSGHMVFDPIRRRELVLTPEEMLRQLVLQYLLQEKKYPAGRIRVEIGIELYGLKRRCDILVFDRRPSPWLLVECKSPKVKLTQSAFEQAAAYNLQLRVPYLAITNGLATACCRFDYEKEDYVFLDAFPDWPA